VIHLITEYTKEEMVQSALELRQDGSLFSLEPLIDFRQWSNKDAIITLLQHVDIVTPDWPSASGIAGSDNPKQVLSYWSKLGPQMVAVRHGQYGSYAWDRSHGKYWHIPPVSVEAIDPTGAGNAYGGGLCVGWDKSHDARTAGCYGAVSAAFLVRTIGVPEMTRGLQSEAQMMLALALKLAQPL
jgi:sugar/nucleoside kinase (ribokinase family)